MGALLLKLRTWWETADRTQKAVTLFGSAFLLLLLSGTYYFASRPKMETLFGGLSAAEAGSISNEIQKMGIPVESDMQGNIRVPSDKLSEVRNALAVAGKSPTTGHVGNEELAKSCSERPPRVWKRSDSKRSSKVNSPDRSKASTALPAPASTSPWANARPS